MDELTEAHRVQGHARDHILKGMKSRFGPQPSASRGHSRDLSPSYVPTQLYPGSLRPREGLSELSTLLLMSGLPICILLFAGWRRDGKKLASVDVLLNCSPHQQRNAQRALWAWGQDPPTVQLRNPSEVQRNEVVCPHPSTWEAMEWRGDTVTYSVSCLSQPGQASLFLTRMEGAISLFLIHTHILPKHLRYFICTSLVYDYMFSHWESSDSLWNAGLNNHVLNKHIEILNEKLSDLGSNLSTAVFLSRALHSENPELTCPGMCLPPRLSRESSRLVLARQEAPLDGFKTSPPCCPVSQLSILSLPPLKLT